MILNLLSPLSQEVIGSFKRDSVPLPTRFESDSVLRVEEVGGKKFEEVDGISTKTQQVEIS